MIEVALSPLRQHTASLCTHLAQCPAIGSAGLRVRCLAEGLHALIAPRLFTTVVVTSILLAAGSVVAGHWT